MKELDGDQRAELERLREAVAEEEPKLTAAIQEYNAALEAAYDKLCESRDEYNRVASEFEDFHSEIMSAMHSVANQAAEGWKESEDGRSFLAWLEAWWDAEESLMGMGVERPQKVAPPEPPVSTIVAALPVRAGAVEVEPEKLDLSRSQVRSATIREDWRRIADFADRTFPEGEFRLAEGATQEQIDAAEAVLGFALPDDVRESYLVHNGSDDTAFAIIGVLSPIDVVARDFAQRRSWPEDGWGTPDEIDGPIRPVWWDTSRVQLTDSGSGDGLTIDLDPADGGTWGQVIHHDHEVGPGRVYAPSWGSLLRRLADDAESGKIVYDEDYNWGHLQDWVFDPPVADATGDDETKPKHSADPGTSAKRYFEFTAGTSSKFWEVYQEGSDMTTRYGKIGANGQSSTKSFDSPKKAAAETAKIIAKKVKEGYVEKTP